MTPEQEIRKVLGDWFEAAPIWYEQLVQQLLGVTNKLETELALARQHKGAWRHLDRDAEKPETHSVCLTWHPEWGVRVSLFGTTGEFDEYYMPRWWQPLPQPPKD